MRSHVLCQAAQDSNEITVTVTVCSYFSVCVNVHTKNYEQTVATCKNKFEVCLPDPTVSTPTSTSAFTLDGRSDHKNHNVVQKFLQNLQ